MEKVAILSKWLKIGLFVLIPIIVIFMFVPKETLVIQTLFFMCWSLLGIVFTALLRLNPEATIMKMDFLNLVKKENRTTGFRLTWFKIVTTVGLVFCILMFLTQLYVLIISFFGGM